VDEKLVSIIAVIAIVGITSILLIPQITHSSHVASMHVPKTAPAVILAPIPTSPKVTQPTMPTLTPQEFEDRLTQIQSGLANGTQNLDMYLVQYKDGKISKAQMLNVTDRHISVMQRILPQYDELNPPELFKHSLQLFRLSTQMEIESDKALREWVVTGDNATYAKSDQLLQQSFQYETNALQSYNDALNGNDIVYSLPVI
jgi:hypothetical protein